MNWLSCDVINVNICRYIENNITLIIISDFSMSEKEDEVENEEEEKTNRKPKKKKLVKPSGDAPAKPRKPAVKRVYEPGKVSALISITKYTGETLELHN